MCGFVGVVDVRSRLTEELLIDMRDTLVHRGPDEEGVWLSTDRTVGFGTRRLKIIDLVAGQQPMHNHDGTIVLAYNGELYNHEALRRELEQAGRRFRTRCDTEVVLAAYEHWGDECLSRFDGMFAFAIWDARQRRLFFARDRAGKKPLYYARTPGGWVFASEIKGILRHPEISRSVDVEWLGYYLSFLATPAPGTLFAGISKVPAAHCGSWTADGGLSIRRWWQLPQSELGVDVSEDDAAEHVRHLFEVAVEKRMMSDVPIGVYLSGGVDSSANVAFMSRYSDEPLRTFSVAFAEEPSLNELAYARQVAQLFGTEHREIVLDDDAVIGSLPHLVHHQDEPIADPVCVPLMHLAWLTKASGVTVVQIGEGSDESFFGYPIHGQVLRGARALRRARMFLPRGLLRSAVGAIAPIVGEHKQEFMVESIVGGIPAPHGIAGLSEQHKARMLRDGVRASSFDYLRSLVGSGVTDDQIADVALNHEFRLRLPELLLMRIDKMTMAASVEARAPFLDHHLIEYVARLPLSFHWSNGQGKRILKKAVAPVLPESVLSQRKRGFGAPVWRWSSSLGQLARDALLRDAIFDYLEPRAVRALLDRAPGSRQGFELWVLLNFALWHRHWIEGEDLRESPQFATRSSPAHVFPTAGEVSVSRASST